MIRTMFRAAPLALALVALSTVALADDAKTPAAAAEARKPGDKARPRKGEKAFPMKAEQFKKVVEKKIARAHEKLEKALEAHNVPDATRVQIEKDFDAGAAQIRTAANRAAADGQVTKEEAKQVKDLAKDLRKQAHEKYGIGKGHKKDGKKTNVPS